MLFVPGKAIYVNIVMSTTEINLDSNIFYSLSCYNFNKTPILSFIFFKHVPKCNNYIFSEGYQFPRILTSSVSISLSFRKWLRTKITIITWYDAFCRQRKHSPPKWGWALRTEARLLSSPNWAISPVSQVDLHATRPLLLCY